MRRGRLSGPGASPISRGRRCRDSRGGIGRVGGVPGGGGHGAVHYGGNRLHGVGRRVSPPLMEVQVKVLSQVQKNFLGRKAWLWTQLGRSKPTREKGLADTGGMACTEGLDTVRAMGLQLECWRI